jgi:hypothetical protein
MGLLDKLTNQGSTLSSLDGKTPQPLPPKTIPLDPKSLTGSNLDLDGKTPKPQNPKTPSTLNCVFKFII